MSNLAFVIALSSAMIGGCRGSDTRAESEIRALLDQQVKSWNAGNLPGYMEAYEKSDHLRFQSGGDVALGWQPLLDRYRSRYQDRAAMGILSFPELNVDVLGPRTALVYGRWQLQRAQDQPSGLLTLLVRKGAQGWRISFDHTSSK